MGEWEVGLDAPSYVPNYKKAGHDHFLLVKLLQNAS